MTTIIADDASKQATGKRQSRNLNTKSVAIRGNQVINHLKSFARRLTSVIGSAAILLFFSEFYFLNEGPVQMVIDTSAHDPVAMIGALVEFVLFYSLFAYIFLIALDRFMVSTVWALLLAGALFGWATESLLVAVVYEAIPISFIFPSISWHALVDVMLGWYLIRRLMRSNSVMLSTVMFILVGMIWGAWATWFWSDTDPTAMAPVLPGDFALYVFVTATLWIIGMVLLDYVGMPQLRISTWEVGLVLLISVPLFIALAIPFLPFSLALLPLIAITLLALWRGKVADTSARILQIFDDVDPAWWQYLLALFTPLTAALVYPILYNNQWSIPTEDITALLFFAGAILFFYALYRAFRQR